MRKSVFFFLFIGCVACSGTGQKPEPSAETPPLENWARPAVKGSMGGAYFVYTNELPAADTVLSVASDAARMVQLHETYETDDGISGMREVKNIILQPEETLVLEEGGLHLMLMNMQRNLAEGDTVFVTLKLAQAGDREIKIPVISPSAGGEDHSNHPQ